MEAKNRLALSCFFRSYLGSSAHLVKMIEPSSMSKDSETSSFNTYRKRLLNSACKSLHYRRLQSEFLESAA